jgi:FlgD Ig-like domain
MQSSAVRVLLCLILPLTAVMGSSASAQAAGTGHPNFLSPTQDGTVPFAWDGPLQVDFSDSPADTYDVSVTCPDGYFWSTSYVYDETQDQPTWTIPQMRPTVDQQCSASAQGTVDDGQHSNSIAFTSKRGLTFLQTSVSPVSFYPRVRDGYRDSTTIRWRLNQPARIGARVKNSRGATVRYLNLGDSTGGGSWTWQGRRNNGGLAAPGAYTVELTATDTSTGTVRRAAKRVHVRTAVRTHRASHYRTGYQLTSSSRSSRCYVNRDSYDDATSLDCWGGRYAQAWYRFAVPRNAFHITRAVVGREGCCDGGSITRQGQRTGRATYRVGLRVTDWRAFSIQRVRITFSWRTRV